MVVLQLERVGLQPLDMLRLDLHDRICQALVVFPREWDIPRAWFLGAGVRCRAFGPLPTSPAAENSTRLELLVARRGTNTLPFMVVLRLRCDHYPAGRSVSERRRYGERCGG